MNRAVAPRIVIVGLGPAGTDLVTEGALAAIQRVPGVARYVRTDRHPSVSVVGDHTSFDARYEQATTLDEVYDGIVAELVDGARRHGEVLYAVPGSPLVAEHTVELLLAPGGPADVAGVAVDVLPALSFLDLAWVRLGVDPVAAGVRVVDGHRFEVEAAGERGPLLVAQCDSTDVLSRVKLAVDPWPDQPVTVLQGLGTPDEAVRVVAWEDLDREVEPDHLTSLYVPVLAAPVGAELVRFAELVALLRRECPWDRVQTHQSLVRHVLEEAQEVVEAIEGLGRAGEDGDADGDPDEAAIAHLEEELGDLLLQVYLHATLAAEKGWFTLADVARGIHDKLVERHPHVFGDEHAETIDDVRAIWARVKAREADA